MESIIDWTSHAYCNAKSTDMLGILYLNMYRTSCAPNFVLYQRKASTNIFAACLYGWYFCCSYWNIVAASETPWAFFPNKKIKYVRHKKKWLKHKVCEYRQFNFVLIPPIYLYLLLPYFCPIHRKAQYWNWVW